MEGTFYVLFFHNGSNWFCIQFFLQHHHALQCFPAFIRSEEKNLAGKTFRAVFDMPMQFNASKAKWGRLKRNISPYSICLNTCGKWRKKETLMQWWCQHICSRVGVASLTWISYSDRVFSFPNWSFSLFLMFSSKEM